MCGIVGVCDLGGAAPAQEHVLREMLGTIRHRGPDEFGIYLDDHVALGNARLSIIDLSTGQQPIANEDGTLWIVFNGEVYNHPELRQELEKEGHRFSTTSDTETVLHAFEEYGVDCLSRFNGQFAVAIWNIRSKSLFLARDRVGVRPLYYTDTGDAVVFGSEVKAILAHPAVTATPDPVALNQIFTYWSTLSPRTFFQGIVEVPPAHYLVVKAGSVDLHRYWQMSFPEKGGRDPRSTTECAEELGTLLVDATRLRLRADVPVGAYLSGGLDSSTITAMIRTFTTNTLETFSIAFTDPDFDESGYQRRMARALGTEHHVVEASYEDIGRAFPDVVWHAETPILRTAPVPMFLLSRLVRDRNFKVVLTGEGADEFLAGYDIFKEAAIRRFWARQPDSESRPALFNRIYPWIPAHAQSGYARSFFGLGLLDTDSPEYSHGLRWRTTARAKRFFSSELRQSLRESGEQTPLTYPEDFGSWHPLSQAQYLESTIFLSQYLLSSQGDRMGMAHSVEGRFPFLDHRVVEYCNALSPEMKLRGLREKLLLKRVGRTLLPTEIIERPKQPFRAPVHRAFFNSAQLDYVRDVLAPSSLARSGYFSPQAVAQLVAKLEQGAALSETDDMALAGIISTELVDRQFVSGKRLTRPLDERDNVKVVTRNRPDQGALTCR